MRKSGEDDIGGDVAKDAKTNLFYCKVSLPEEAVPYGLHFQNRS